MKAEFIYNQPRRKKAFLGALIAGVIAAGAQIASSAISANKQKKAMQEQERQAQETQNLQDSINQAATMSAAANDREYIDQYNEKQVFKCGGRRKAVGGIPYKAIDNSLFSTSAYNFKPIELPKAEIKPVQAPQSNSIGNQPILAGISAVGDIVSALVNKPYVPKQPKRGTVLSAPNNGNKKVLTNNIYPNQNIVTPYFDRMQMYKIGGRKQYK